MEVNGIKRDTVDRLRTVKKEKGLSTSQIIDMLEEKGYYLSESTVKRVFSENGDTSSFRYRDTIMPLADVLLDLYSDQSGAEETEALRAMIRDKNMTISVLVAKNEEIRADFEKQIVHLKKKQIERLEKNLDFREKMIDRKDAMAEKLFSQVIHKDEIIEKLLTKREE